MDFEYQIFCVKFNFYMPISNFLADRNQEHLSASMMHLHKLCMYTFYLRCHTNLLLFWWWTLKFLIHYHTLTVHNLIMIYKKLINSLSHWAASMIQNDKMMSTFLLVMPSFAIFSDCIQDCRASWERPWNVVFYKKLN